MSNQFWCEACGGVSAEAMPYKVTMENSRMQRLALRIGRALPLPREPRGRFGPLVRRFADGLFVGRRVMRCVACGLGILWPKPSEAELGRYYEAFYWNDTVSLPLPMGPRAQVQIDFLGEVVNLESMEASVEFGAGPANISRLLFEQGRVQRVAVVERSRAYQAAYAEMGDVIHDAYSDFPSAGRFDLILSSHSLEHVHDIGATLDQWRGSLNPGGAVFIEVPHHTRESMDGHGSFHKPHMYFLAAAALGLLARNHGFAVAAMETFGPSYEEFLGHRKIDDEQLRRRNSEGIWLRAVLQA